MTNQNLGYFTLARFADNLYENLIAKLKSSEWEASQQLRKRKVLSKLRNSQLTLRYFVGERIRAVHQTPQARVDSQNDRRRAAKTHKITTKGM